MGSNNMANSLIFMAYSDSTGKNITLSPRLVYDHVEPSYTSNISVQVLPGSGIANDIMTVNAMCTNCRSWEGGSIDPTNTAAEFIFAVGPDGDLKSSEGSANIKRHTEYGNFVMDLTKALGVAGVPVALTGMCFLGEIVPRFRGVHEFCSRTLLSGGYTWGLKSMNFWPGTD
jgi:hypothetical protein